MIYTPYFAKGYPEMGPMTKLYNLEDEIDCKAESVATNEGYIMESLDRAIARKRQGWDVSYDLEMAMIHRSYHKREARRLYLYQKLHDAIRQEWGI